jgi:prevent-host-death family protein
MYRIILALMGFAPADDLRFQIGTEIIHLDIMSFTYIMCVNKKKGAKMKLATVGEIQKNFARVLRRLKGGEDITVTKRGVPVALILPVGPRKDIEWPDFYEESQDYRKKPVSDIVIDGRKDRI